MRMEERSPTIVVADIKQHACPNQFIHWLFTDVERGTICGGGRDGENRDGWSKLTHHRRGRREDSVTPKLLIFFPLIIVCLA